MTWSRLPLLTALAVGLAMATISCTAGTPEPILVPSPEPQVAWEYREIWKCPDPVFVISPPGGFELEGELNELGRMGWELVDTESLSVIDSDGDQRACYVATLRRRLARSTGG